MPGLRDILDAATPVRGIGTDEEDITRALLADSPDGANTEGGEA